MRACLWQFLFTYRVDEQVVPLFGCEFTARPFNPERSCPFLYLGRTSHRTAIAVVAKKLHASSVGGIVGPFQQDGFTCFNTPKVVVKLFELQKY